MYRFAATAPRLFDEDAARSGDLRARLHLTRSLLFQAALTVLLLVVTLKLWRTDIRVPMYYWGDTLPQLAIAKSIADGGWIWFIDRLGAPFGFAMAAYPQNLTTTSIVLKSLSLFSKEPGFLLNVYWLSTIVAASVNAHLALRVLGYGRSSATVFATLYAFLPYAFYRNIAHVSLVFTFVPVLAAYAVQIAANTAASLRSRWGMYVVICAIAQAFDYIYYTFFGAFVFIVAGILAWSYHRSAKHARIAFALCAVLVVSATINLTPSLLEWSRDGKPANDFDKTAAQTEIYGLKLRQLLSPVQPSRLTSLQAFGEKEKQFPNENENRTTRLGVVLSIGFVVMLAQFLFSPRLAPQPRAAGALTLACVLLATVGGFGALFSFLVTPDIRAYNRIVVFIAFFAIVYLAHVVDTWCAQIDLRERKPWSSAVVPFAMAFVLIVGVLDEGQAARPIVGRYAIDAATFHAERTLVRDIERRHPNGGAVMQLPEAIFTPDNGRVKMQPYDHARAYLASRTLSWSWPSYSSRRKSWYESLGNPADPGFLDRLATSGFVGVWIDRFGYEPSELAKLEGALTARLGPPLVGGLQQRYAYFDLSRRK